MSLGLPQETVEKQLEKIGKVAAWLESIPTGKPEVEEEITAALVAIERAHGHIVQAFNKSGNGENVLFWESPNGQYAIVFTAHGIRVDNNSMLTNDWPIQYDSGRIAYANPYWFPRYVKSKVYEAFAAKKREKNANHTTT